MGRNERGNLELCEEELLQTNHTAAGDARAAVEHELDRSGVESMLHAVQLHEKACFGIIRGNRHSFLEKNRAMIDVMIHEVDGHPGHFGPPDQHITDRMRAGKGWQQRRVNVQDALRKMLDEHRREDAHESGQADELNPSRLEQSDERTLISAARGIAVRVHKERVDTETLRPLQRLGLRPITDHEGHARVQSLCTNGLENRLEVGALSGTEDRECRRRAFGA